MVANRESSRNNRNSRNCKRKITNAGRCEIMLKKTESAKTAGKPQNAAPKLQQSHFIRTSGECKFELTCMLCAILCGQNNTENGNSLTHKIRKMATFYPAQKRGPDQENANSN